MAFELDRQDDENLDPNAPRQLSGGTGVLDASGQAPAPGTPGQDGSTPFAGIQRALGANQAATQRLGDRVAQTISDTGTTARSTIEEGRRGFEQDVAAGEVRSDQDLLGRVASDPTGIAGSESDREAFLRQRDAQYQGPSQLEDTDSFSAISQALGRAREAQELAGTSGGRRELIAQTRSNQGPLSLGALTLDEALLASDPNAIGAVRSAAAGISGLDAEVQAASEAARARATEGREATDSAREAARGALGDAYSGFESGLDERVAQQRADAQARIDAARRAVSGLGGQFVAGTGSGAERLRARQGFDLAEMGDLTPEQQANMSYLGAGKGVGFVNRADDPRAAFTDQVLADLGLNMGAVDVLANPALNYRGAGMGQANRDRQMEMVDAAYAATLGDLGRYLSAQSPDAQINRANVATADDYARLAALNELSGEQNLFLDPTQVDLAGTAPGDLVDFDTSGLESGFVSGVNAAARERARLEGFNRRSGGGTWGKNFGNSDWWRPVTSSAGGGSAGPNRAALESQVEQLRRALEGGNQ